MEDEEKRHSNSFDTVSLLPEDATVASPEEEIEGKLTFQELVRELTTETEKFIALALYLGFNKRETAKMLRMHPPKITLIIKDMRKELKIYYKNVTF